MVNCACGEDWRIEAADLRTGQVRTILHPLQFDFDSELNRVGKSGMTFGVRDISLRDVWPHLTSVFVVRNDPQDGEVVEWGGYVEKVAGTSSGSLQVGLVSMDDYPHKRMLRTTHKYTRKSQTSICASLVNSVAANGIPLTGVAGASRILRDRTYNSWDRKFVGVALEEMSDVARGPDWVTTHHKDENGRWQTVMTFVDFLGDDNGVVIRSDIESNEYGIDVDAKDHATLVDATGAGDGPNKLIATASDLSVYPQFDASPSWSDVKRRDNLKEHAEGYVDDYAIPVAVPSVTIPGLENPRLIGMGDIVTADISHGAIVYKGRARVMGIGWKIDGDGASRTYSLMPVDDAHAAILNYSPTDPDQCCEVPS